MEETNPLEANDRNIIDQLKAYGDTLVKYHKYKAIKVGGRIVAGMVLDVVAIVCLLIVALFASITLGLYLSDVFQSYWKGFGSVAIIYALIVFLVSAFRGSIERPVRNKLTKHLAQDSQGETPEV